MQLPNKLFSYDESLLPNLVIVLRHLQDKPMSVSALYKQVRTLIPEVHDFIEVLDSLYALRKIDYDDKQGDIYYVD